MALDATRTVATGAGRRDIAAGTVALGAGLLDREKALLHAHLAVTVAGGAGLGFGAFLGAAAIAGFAFVHGRNANLGIGSARSIFKRNLEVVTQVSTTIDIGASASTTATTAKDVTENIGERIGESGTAGTTHARLRINAGVAVLVVGGTFLAVGKHLVSLFGFLEHFFRFGIVRVAIRMVLHGHLAIGLLDLVV